MCFYHVTCAFKVNAHSLLKTSLTSKIWVTATKLEPKTTWFVNEHSHLAKWLSLASLAK